jgi:hypothetical protein
VKKFQRRIEDFTCERCGCEVKGSGYTNHCPSCLWSKHVDVNPGDRQSSCGGSMQPAALEKRGKDYILLHRCVRCGFERRNRSVPEDDFASVIELSRRLASP